jgi:DNA-directed RNA polymerase specialized sigma24 family protein
LARLAPVWLHVRYTPTGRSRPRGSRGSWRGSTADPDRAAQEYERLRLTLVKFFDWRGASPPDECADDTIDRLAAKLEAGNAIDDVFRYAHGIARLVLMEWRRRQAQIPIEQADPSRLRAAWPAVPTRPLHECFTRCLAALPDESRALVLEYYGGAIGQQKINKRERLGPVAGNFRQRAPQPGVQNSSAARAVHAGMRRSRRRARPRRCPPARNRRFRHIG